MDHASRLVGAVRRPDVDLQWQTEKWAVCAACIKTGDAHDGCVQQRLDTPTGMHRPPGMRVSATDGSCAAPVKWSVSVRSLVLENFVLGKTGAYLADEGFVCVWVLAMVN